MKKLICLAVFASVMASAHLNANEHVSKSPDDARVYIISPQNGETVAETFKVQFGLENMGVAPAGTDKENTGHHHILIDTDIGDVDLSQPLPATDNIKHFGGGQTESLLTLPKGEHTLQLVLGNHLHIPHDKPVLSDIIVITVE